MSVILGCRVVPFVGLLTIILMACSSSSEPITLPPVATPQPQTKPISAECFNTEAEPQPLSYDLLNGPVSTGFDGNNSAGCIFSKPVSEVSVILRNGDGAAHRETFSIEPPSLEIRFPLPEGLSSEKTLGMLEPGQYNRQLLAKAEDGDTWDITANIDAALKIVTVIESKAPVAAEPTPTPKAVVSSPTATPAPSREWELVGYVVDGSKVTVLVRVYAGIDVRVSLDGEEPEHVEGPPPVLRFVFRDAIPGYYTIRVHDVTGQEENQPVEVGLDHAPDGPLDTALVELVMLSTDDGTVSVKVEGILAYNRLPEATYPRLEAGEEIPVNVYQNSFDEVRQGDRYKAELSLCLAGQVEGLSCEYEGWSAALQKQR